VCTNSQGHCYDVLDYCDGQETKDSIEPDCNEAEERSTRRRRRKGKEEGYFRRSRFWLTLGFRRRNLNMNIHSSISKAGGG